MGYFKNWLRSNCSKEVAKEIWDDVSGKSEACQNHSAVGMINNVAVYASGIPALNFKHFCGETSLVRF